MIEKTRVTEEFDRLGVSYKFMWDTTTGLVSGMDIARGLNAVPEKVFKTLVIGNKKKGCYFCIHDSRESENGCSPVAISKKLPVFFDQSAANFDTIIFSAGENSYHVEVTLEELKKAIDFQLVDVAGDIQEE